MIMNGVSWEIGHWREIGWAAREYGLTMEQLLRSVDAGMIRAVFGAERSIFVYTPDIREHGCVAGASGLN